MCRRPCCRAAALLEVFDQRGARLVGVVPWQLEIIMTVTTPGSPTRLATFGGGCFWCLEAVFEQLRGVTKVQSGYSGGHVPNATYQQVCSGRTGHAEVIQVTFDPCEISFTELLDVFFAMH